MRVKYISGGRAPYLTEEQQAYLIGLAREYDGVVDMTYRVRTRFSEKFGFDPSAQRVNYWLKKVNAGTENVPIGYRYSEALTNMVKAGWFSSRLDAANAAVDCLVNQILKESLEKGQVKQNKNKPAQS